MVIQLEGSAHHIYLSAPQLKKLHALHRKDSAYTVIFDPHQAHRHSSGFMGDIPKGVKTASHNISIFQTHYKKGAAEAKKCAHEKLESIPEFQ